MVEAINPHFGAIFREMRKQKKAILRAINLFDELDSQELGNYYRTRFSLLIKMKL